MTASVSSLPCPVCGAMLADHENDNHVYCTSCAYYTNRVFAQYFVQTKRELEVRDELEKHKKEGQAD